VDVAKIKAVLLASVGNPESGVLSDCADDMALAILKAYENDGDCCKQGVKEFNPVKETRVIKVSESR
jgi:hypothetical protein